MTTTNSKNHAKPAAAPDAAHILDALDALDPRAAMDQIDSDWGDDALFEVVALPSGKRVQVQPVSLLSMIANKSLPDTLMAAARRSAGLNGKANGQANGQAASAPSEEDAQDGMQLIDFMVCAMCVRPRFVRLPTAECAPGERSVYAMWDTDKTFLFNHAMQGQQALKSSGE